MSRRAVAYLTALDPLLLQPQYSLYDKGARIGRDAEVCDIILSAGYVSRHHCEFFVHTDGVKLADEGSTNGTFVNGERVTERFLEEGDEVSCGRAGPPHFIFTHQSAGQERIFLLPRQSQYKIGRLSDNDLPLVNDSTVSSNHAIIEVSGDQLHVYDSGSSNGTYVNDRRVSGQSIGPNDIVRIGSSELSFSIDADGLRVRAREKRNQVRLEAVNLRRQHQDKRLLHDISLVIEPGAYVGVLGPSGAGKSTLLNALNGFVPAEAGEVLLNDTSLYDAYDMFRNAIGYVPQDDIIHKELTVEQSLFYTAQLRLPSDYSKEGLSQQVTSVIETLGLDHVRHSFITQLSGGQRKRVSIGCELLTRPSVLFLDEPTSGLDPSTEEKLMHHFGRMAEQGQTVILTTHILYNLQLLDYVILLARGRLVYYGPVTEVCNHFSDAARTIERPIEIFDLLEPEASAPEELDNIAEKYQEKYLNSPLYQSYVHAKSKTLPEVQQKNAGQQTSLGVRIKSGAKSVLNLRQWSILTRRMFDLKLAFPKRLLVPLSIPILLALLTATISVKDPETGENARAAFESANEQGLGMLGQTGLISRDEFLELRFEGFGNLPIPLSLPLLMVMTAVFLGTLSACLEISGERPVYLRERAVNLGIPVYLASKLPALFLLAAIQSFLYVAIVTVLLRMPHVEILPLVLIITGVAWVSCTIGLLISSLDPTAGQNSVVLAVVAVLPQLLFSGAMGPSFYGGMHVVTQVIASMFPARWGFELMLTALYQEPGWAEGLIIGDEEAGGMGFRFGADVFTRNALALTGLATLYFVATCVSLRRYDRL